MKVGGWDFSKLPKHRHDEVIEAVDGHMIGVLVAIHDEYKLSSFKAYCCHGNGSYTWEFYNEAIKQGFITKAKTDG